MVSIAVVSSTRYHFRILVPAVSSFQQCCGYKYDVPVKWDKPEKHPITHPSRTGDLVPHLELDWTKPPNLFLKSEEYQTADENVKKLFSAYHLGRFVAAANAKEEMLDRVKNHKYDNESMEASIALMTAKLRNFGELFEKRPYCYNKFIKVKLRTYIEKRNKNLKLLRKFDYKRFEWVLERLDLWYIFRSPPYDRLERKKSIRRLTDKYCEELRAKKLEEYKRYLNGQKEDFLKSKIETLRWIRNEEIECGIEEPSITEEDIEKAKIQLEDHLSTIEIVKEEPDENLRLDL